MKTIQLVVFSLALALATQHAAQAQQLTVLHEFTGGNGGQGPFGIPVVGSGGVLYGAAGGGTAGVIWSLTPPTAPGGTWSEQIIYNFTGAPGTPIDPNAGLVMDANGVLYGTTPHGGGDLCRQGCGTVYAVTPPAIAGGAWTESVLFAFGTVDTEGEGREPCCLVVGPDGVLYDLTTEEEPQRRYGTLFSLAPPTAPGGQWTYTMLHKFTGENGEGSSPNGLIWANGALYGTNQRGGANGHGVSGGTVFQMTPPSVAGGPWTETILYSFGAPLASDPAGALVLENGAIYGTAFNGTAASCQECGAVFELSPPAAPGGTWSETVLYDFAAWADGRAPAGLLCRNGALYGTTYYGGTADGGTIFELQPPSVAGGTWTETLLYSFTDVQEGVVPSGGLAPAPNGDFYLSTVEGGPETGVEGYGGVFKFTP